MKRTFRLRQRLWISVLSLLLFACSSSKDELERYIHSVKIRPGKEIEPLPEFKPYPKFVYQVDDKRRNPFKPIQPEQKQQQVDVLLPNTKRPKQPLEAFPLDSLKFVGILKQGRLTWGLISQPGGLVSKVKAGDYMGKNYGKVIYIKDNLIGIEETVQVNGHWERKKITLSLRLPD